MIDHNGFYLLRTPALPYKSGLNITTKTLKKIYQNKYLQEALFIASPSFFDTFELWLSGALVAKDNVRVEITLLKYYLRASFRCTPFGLFAGVSTGYFSNNSLIKLKGLDDHPKNVRFDMNYLSELIDNISKDPVIRNQLRFYHNNTSYTKGDEIRYVEYKISNGIRSHKLNSIDNNEYIKKVIDLSREGSKYNDLVEDIKDDDITLEEASDFINELIESKILISELEPKITGGDILKNLISKLNTYLPSNDNLIKTLKELDSDLDRLKKSTSADSLPIYSNIFSELEAIGINFEKNQIFQVDQYKEASTNFIDKNVLTSLVSGINLLINLNKQSENTTLKTFKEAFSSRYEDREIPLVEVLDNELGIGYPKLDHSLDPSPLLDKILLVEPILNKRTIVMSEWDDLLLEIYTKSIQNNESIIKLDDYFKNHPLNSKIDFKLPASFFSIISLLKDHKTDDSYKIYYQGTIGPSAANYLGRFAYLDIELEDLIKRTLEEEQDLYPEAILAEVIHINQARTGNVVIRPNLRKYEIPILNTASTGKNETILINDLLVCVRQGRIILRSKRLNKEVIPRMSSAHNHFHNTLPVYHFLIDLQNQGRAPNLSWDWGVLKNLSFLPRVEFGNIIFSRACWTLGKSDIDQIAMFETSDIRRLMNVFRKSRNIPRNIVFQQFDNELPIDLNNELSIKLLQNLIAGKSKVTIYENIFNSSSLFVDTPLGKVTNEFIIPLKNTNFQNRSSPIRAFDEPSSFARSFPIGSEWLFFKIYCGVKTSDKILFEIYNELIKDLTKNKIVDGWFFIRYADPNYHLRIRFHGNKDFYNKIIPRMYSYLYKYQQSGEISNISIDTYQPEYERYGFKHMKISEEIFFEDSVASVQLIELIEEYGNDNIRWQLAVKGVDCMLDALGLDLHMKQNLMEQLQGYFKTEFNANNSTSKKSIADKYRTHKKSLESILTTNRSDDKIFQLAFSIFKLRDHNIKKLIEIKESTEKSDRSFAINLSESYVHMFVNRLMRSKQRAHEMVIYDFLNQFYISQLKRRN